MRRIWWVARREYIEHVRTKSFLVGILLLPLMFAVSFGIGALLDKAGDRRPIVVVDAGAGVSEDVVRLYEGKKQSLSARTVSPAELDAAVKSLTDEVLAKRLSAFIVLTTGLAGQGGEARYYTDNPSREEPRGSLMRAVNEAVHKQRLADAGIAREVFDSVFAPVPSRDFNLKEGSAEVSKKSREAKSFIPMIFVYLMFIGIMSHGQTMLTSTIEEKSNRVMEVLLSSVSPFQLMTGKMLGLGLVSLTLFAVWMAGGAYAIVKYDLQSMLTFSTLGFFLLYYFLGYLIYAAVMGALGSLCNELKDAQNMMTPMIVIMIIPLAMMFWVGQNPDHPIGRILSFIPLFTPFLMINRISSALPPGPVEIALSIVALLGGIMLTVWLAARVFRVGVLLYGKPPSPREVVRWMREA